MWSTQHISIKSTFKCVIKRLPHPVVAGSDWQWWMKQALCFPHNFKRTGAFKCTSYIFLSVRNNFFITVSRTLLLTAVCRSFLRRLSGFHRNALSLKSPALPLLLTTVTSLTAAMTQVASNSNLRYSYKFDCYADELQFFFI